MLRTTTRAKKQNAKKEEGGLPQFSPAFIDEVGACRDIVAFQELMEAKGLWLNRNAAEDVFGYLHSMSNRRLRDEDLAPVIGGVSRNGLTDDHLVATLQLLSDQLNGTL